MSVLNTLFHNRVGFRLLKARRQLQSPLELFQRTRVARRRNSAVPALRVDARTGYRFIEPGELPGVDRVVSRLQDVVDEMRPHLTTITSSQPGHFRITFDLLSDSFLARNPELLEFVLGDDLLDSAIDYFGSVPSLRRLGLAYSPCAQDDAWSGSQLAHLDGEDNRQLKFFVNVSEVAEHDGPFTFWPADRTKEVLPHLRAVGHHPESRLRAGPYPADALDPSDPAALRMIGPPGRALLVDTSRCLHYGSRVRSDRGRFVLGAAFRSYAVAHESPHNSFDPGLFPGDSLRRRVLDHQHPVPAGWFFPDPVEEPGPGHRGGSRS